MLLWQVVVADPAEVAALRIGMAPGGSFGGRDQRTPLDYKGFRLFAAWRLQHLGLWGKYSMERENMRIIDAKALGGVGGPRVPLRQAYVDMANRCRQHSSSSVDTGTTCLAFVGVPKGALQFVCRRLSNCDLDITSARAVVHLTL